MQDDTTQPAPTPAVTWTADDCARCGQTGATRFTLSGGYFARLCECCTNEWNRYALGAKEYAELEGAFARLAHAVNRQSDFEIDECVVRRIQATLAMHDAAKAWVAAGKTEAK